MQIAILTLTKQGLNIDYIMSMPVQALSGWVDSAIFLATGKKPIPADVRKGIAERNSAALAKLAAMKKDGEAS